MKKILLSLMFLFVVFGLFSCTLIDTDNETMIGDEVVFESKDDLISLLERVGGSYGFIGVPESSVDQTNQPKRDYSKTNTQVNGVDEADIVKTDGTYIYLTSKNSVQIAKAYPVDEMELVETITYENGFYPNSLYVDDEYLVVIGRQNNYQEDGDYHYYGSKTKIIIYDKQNYETPQDIILIDGYTVTTRKVNNELLVITNQYISYDKNHLESFKLPKLKINESDYEVSYRDIHYNEGTYPDSFITLSKFNLNQIEDDLSQYTYLGSSHHVYVSLENVYIAQNVYYFDFLLDDVNTDDADSEDTTTTKEEEKEDTKSIVTKINYTDDAFGDSQHVIVKGYVHNQFSMDEYQNTFRIATTSGAMWWSDDSINNLYIYDENFELLSSIEGIAEGERIQSARFVGDWIYLVTFRQIDPFFVINVEDPENPIILSELKISGYSTYLHPYDDSHIIGFGFETEVKNENGREFTVIKGLKMTMFDVEDPENPEAIFNEVIDFGNQGYAYTELNYNHKALLFNKDKKLFAFPFTSTSYRYEENTYRYYYHQSYKVFHVDLENGFTYQTDITHFDEDKENGYQYGYQINRGMYIEDVLYTVSLAKIQAHRLDTYEWLETLDLEFNEEVYYDWCY